MIQSIQVLFENLYILVIIISYCIYKVCTQISNYGYIIVKKELLYKLTTLQVITLSVSGLLTSVHSFLKNNEIR